MPITRTYACPECNHFMTVVLAAEQWDDPPPSCEACDARETQQIFKPPAIGGSARSRAAAIAEDIAAKDYNVANLHAGRREGDVAKISYKEPGAGAQASTWGMGADVLQNAMAIGRQTRLQHGNGLDILQGALKSGDQPDLIAESKKRSARIW